MPPNGVTMQGRQGVVAVFNYALSPAQIQTLYASGSQLDQVLAGVQSAGADLNLTWAQGTLLQATNVNGPWLRASTAASPLVVAPTNDAMFYRVLLRQ